MNNIKDMKNNLPPGQLIQQLDQIQYDYAIVGAGPTGLTLAYYLGKAGKNVVLIDREQSIGGCHRVRRVDGLFTEHGPRITIGNYFCLKHLLTDFGVSWNDLYTPYNFSTNTSAGELLSTLSFGELGH